MRLEEFLVPDIGEGLAEVEIIDWHVGVGDHVREHQTLASVETDKSVVEVPSPYTGVVRELRGQPGDRIPVGAVLVVIEADETGPGPGPGRAPAAAAVDPGPEPAPVPEPASGNGSRRRAAPAVRRLARELGVDLQSVTPTGKGGLVVAEDVRGAAVTAGPAHAEEAGVTPPRVASPGRARASETVPLRGLRRTIARNLSAVARVPHITSHREVEATALLAWRERFNARRPERPLTLTPFLAMCVIGALRAVPRLNATFDEEREEITRHGAIHLGIATATDDGLLVPVVHDADLRDLAGLADEIDALAAAARERSLRPEQMAGGTFTVTNYGTYGGWFGTPLLRAPEIGIAGFGRVARRPWVTADGELAVAEVLPMSVSVDHRIVDGDLAGRFGEALAGMVTDPLRLLEAGAPWS